LKFEILFGKYGQVVKVEDDIIDAVVLYPANFFFLRKKKPKSMWRWFVLREKWSRPL